MQRKNQPKSGNQHICSIRRDTISHVNKIFPDTTWFGAVQRKWRKFIAVSASHPEVSQYLKSRAAIEKENKRRVEKHGSIIHPLSIFRLIWNIYIFLVMFIHQMIRAYTVGFSRNQTTENIEPLFWADIVLCCALFVDIGLSFCTGRINFQTGAIILDSYEIIEDYFINFFFDLFQCFPLVFILPSFTDFSSVTEGQLVIFMITLFVFSIQRFRSIMSNFTSVPSIFKLSEKATIVVKLGVKTIFL
jgi:hypothetical protein